jgi:hypothetical protein
MRARHDGRVTDRCTPLSAAAGEDQAGTAPGEGVWLLVEQPGPWGRKALRESDLPDDVAALLGGLGAHVAPGAPGVRVQLVRRPGRSAVAPGAGRTVLAARPGGPGGALVVTRLEVHDLRALLDHDPADLAAGRLAGAAPYGGPLWLVCTNGRRDVCCAELGRPVAAALAERWPEATWESTHLGGHRFSATLLALPAGVALGRLDPATALAACAELEARRLPLDVARGRTGQPASAQVAELALRRRLGLTGLDAVAVVDTGAGGVELEVRGAGQRWYAAVTSRPGVPSPASCGDAKPKAAPVHEVALRPLGA